MKKTDLKEKSFVFLIGRGVFITAILTTSALSFTLGYFVGKIARPQPQPVENSITATRQASTEQKDVAPTLQPEQTQKTPETQQTQETQKTRETPKTKKYTVQVSAFQNASDAERLKKKLDKKGYKTYITTSETKKHEKLYKVRTGEFKSRKEAEILSIKIRKTEGLQAFVTFRTAEEGLR
ncbi:MAG: SPOR domain-containing protein [Nitrospirae bacterium]|nr:SPOR domain-containing protein [Nitrospirota bacterium]